MPDRFLSILKMANKLNKYSLKNLPIKFDSMGRFIIDILLCDAGFIGFYI